MVMSLLNTTRENIIIHIIIAENEFTKYTLMHSPDFSRFFWLTQLITVFRFIPWIKSQNFLDLFALVIYFLTLVAFGAGI